jgi:hypothetical protein
MQPPLHPPRKTLAQLALLLAGIAIAVAGGEAVCRVAFSESPWNPGPQVHAVQAQLRLEPDCGFIWKASIAYTNNVVLAWNDIVPEPLSTDRLGFRNLPDAMTARAGGRPIDVLGVGDSFMHDASYFLYRFFRERGLLYYNMAMHRYCPPQYNVVLSKYGLPQKPGLVLYGLFENDFLETADYGLWRSSGLDWFTYHSGTWGGPPLCLSRTEVWFRTHLPGCYTPYRSFLAKHAEDDFARRHAAAAVREVEQCIMEAFDAARSAGVGFLLVLIPSKQTTSAKGVSEWSPAYDLIVSAMRRRDVPVLDLRDVFARCGRFPGDLFQRADDHWNESGMGVAAEAIYRFAGRFAAAP